MTDDQQRARESAPSCLKATLQDMRQRGWISDIIESLILRAAAEDTAALRAAPEVIRIPAGDGLDPITLYVDDAGNGSGHLTITCYADAWTCYWGSMGCELTKFVAGVGAEYLLSSMLWPNLGSTRKMTQAYVKRIAQRVINQLAHRPHVTLPQADLERINEVAASPQGVKDAT